MTKNKNLSPFVGIHVIAGAVLASQVTSFAEDTQLEELDPISVIATKFERNLSDVASSVDVLAAEELNLVGGVSLLNAISHRLPGVAVFSTAGQRGNVGNIHLRGTENDHSQIRLDGVRIHSGSGGLNNFIGKSSLQGVQSVEILKGSGGLYGSSAIGGVVSLTTAKGEGEPSHKLFTEYGSYDSFVGSLSSQGVVGDFSYNIGVSTEQTKNDPIAPVDGNDFDKFGYYGRFDYNLGNDDSIGLIVRGIDTRFENPFSRNVVIASNLTEVQNYDALFTTLFYEKQVTEELNSKFTFGYSFEDLDIDAPNGDDSRTDTDRYSVSLDNRYVWNDKHESVFGVYYERLEYDALAIFGTFVEPSAQDRDTYGVFYNHTWSASDLFQLSGTIAWDDHDNFGDEFTWNTGVVVHVSDFTRFKANVGTAYRSPSIVDLNPLFGSAVDPNIEAEESQNWDVSVEHQVANTLFKLTWFENDVENAIENPTFTLVTNLPGKSKSNGIEFSIESVIEELDTRVYASYTYYQNQLNLAVPEQVASLEVAKSFSDKLEASLIATWVDEKTLGAVLDEYFLVNAKVSYDFSESLQFHVRVENLLDESYLLADFTSFGETPINARGRGGYAGVSYTF